jgi:hypothetical protein
VEEARLRHVLIVRDPRAVVVSHLFWWKRHKDIDTWPFRFFRRLETDKERLRFLILGDEHPKVSETEREMGPFPNLIERYRSYERWLSSAGCLTVRFEDFVSESSRTEVFQRIHRHIYGDDEAFSDDVYQAMLSGTRPEKSKTYRSGDRRTWEDLLGAEDVETLEGLGLRRVLDTWGYPSP